MASNRVGRDVVILTASKIITLLISLVSAMLLSRFRTLGEYGTYSQLLLLSNLASAIFSLGLPSSSNYFLVRAQSAEERRRFLSVFYTLCTGISIVIGAALVFAIPLASAYFKNQEIEKFAFFLAIFPWTSVIIGTVGNVLVVYEKTKKLLLLNLINSLTSLLSIILVEIFRWSFREYMVINLFTMACVALWVYVIVFKLEGYIKPSINAQTVKTLLRFAIPLGLASLVGTISYQIDKLMIGWLFDTERLAIYTNAAQELPLTMIASSFTAVLLPQMAKRLQDHDTQGTLRIWGYSIQLSYIIICFCTMACVVFAPNIISILYSNKYLPGVSVFIICSFVMLLRVTYFGIVLNSLGRTRFILYSSVISLILNATLNYPMYLIFGFVGPAIATLLSIGIVNGLQLAFTAKTLSVKFKQIFPWGDLLKITLINALLAIVAYVATALLRIETDARGNAIAVAIGFVVLLVYALCMKSKAMILWRQLNDKQ